MVLLTVTAEGDFYLSHCYSIAVGRIIKLLAFVC